MAFEFEVTANDGETAARTGRLQTPHGVLETPVFAPVGTQATVKAVRPSDLQALGATLILSNTYHLYLRPGDELIRDLGRAAHIHGLGWADFDGQRRLPGLQLKPNTEDRRGRGDFPIPSGWFKPPLYAGEEHKNPGEFGGGYHHDV